ncbi:FUSC family protein [Herbiconiux daphne]|uniref:FUSC family protein n=1 Tax=Herbiconiux daphne TaxID=2970914 RepID=A0ABT2H5P2_9MICO|nr:FUSC family protein [Herbiconiux daphne]MCS5735254.1 FUSC family protein [Herbiconiux daphne]
MNQNGAFASLVRLNGPGGRWPIALRAGLAVAIPIAVFSLAGAPALGLQASIGAFTALYVANAPVRERLRVLPLIAVGLVACAAAGAMLAGSSLAVAIGLVLVSAAASILLYGFAVGPPGPVFFPLVFGAAAHITAPVDGVRVVDPLLFVTLVAGGCLFAYLLAIAPVVLPRSRRVPARTLRQRFPTPRFTDEPTRTLIRRSITVAVLGSAIALAVEPERAYWVVCAALAVVSGGSSRALTMTRGLHRVIGTIAGAVLYLGLAELAPSGLWLALLLGALQFAVELFVVRNYALALVFITPLVLTITGTAASAGSGTGAEPLAFAVERLVDTAIGAALAVVAALVWHERHPSADH